MTKWICFVFFNNAMRTKTTLGTEHLLYIIWAECICLVAVFCIFPLGNTLVTTLISFFPQCHERYSPQRPRRQFGCGNYTRVLVAQIQFASPCRILQPYPGSYWKLTLCVSSQLRTNDRFHEKWKLLTVVYIQLIMHKQVWKCERFAMKYCNWNCNCCCLPCLINLSAPSILSRPFGITGKMVV